MIHKTAIISQKAKIGKGVDVGPYSIIKDGVRIGANCQIGSFCVIEGDTTVGNDCNIFSGAIIGSIPQDLKYKGQKSILVIGNNNIIREYVTINPGTQEGSKTIIGNSNLLMAYSHVAHDCTIGNDCIIANGGTLAGHVEIHDKAVIGGLVAIHQFCRVGKLSIIGGCSKVVQDIPPFSTCDGHPARVYGLNSVGLKRLGINKEEIGNIRQAFKILFFSGISMSHALEKIEKEINQTPLILDIFKFIQSTQRGLCRAVKEEKELV